MNKKLIKRVAVASLAALVTIPNIVGTVNASVLAEYMNEEYTGECFYLPIRSVSNMGNGLSKFIDDNGDEYIAYTSEIQEYQNLVAQGLDHKLISVSSTSTHYIGQSQKEYITNYNTKGGGRVALSNDALLPMKDKYSFGPLIVEKYLMGQQGTTNQMQKDLYLLKKNLAEDEAKRQAEAIKDKQEIELNKQINTEMDIYSNNYNNFHNSQLPYTADYIRSYHNTELTKSQENLWVTFDNERNYIQQWLDKHNLTLKQLRDMCYTTENLDENIKKYGKQMAQANIYFKWIENGTLPKNCTTGDWIRYMLREENRMQGWNWLGIWDKEKNCDFTPVSDGGFHGFGTLKDISRINEEIYKMIEKDMEVIADYKSISTEEKWNQIMALSNEMCSSFAGDEWSKQRYSSFQKRGDLINKLKNKWDAQYNK